MARHFLMLYGLVLIIINNLVCTPKKRNRLKFLALFGTDYTDVVWWFGC